RARSDGSARTWWWRVRTLAGYPASGSRHRTGGCGARRTPSRGRRRPARPERSFDRAHRAWWMCSLWAEPDDGGDLYGAHGRGFLGADLARHAGDTGRERTKARATRRDLRGQAVLIDLEAQPQLDGRCGPGRARRGAVAAAQRWQRAIDAAPDDRRR